MKLELTMVTNRMDATNVFGAEVRPGQRVEAQKCPVRPSRRPSRRPSSSVVRRFGLVRFGSVWFGSVRLVRRGTKSWHNVVYE